ncbi:MAG: hypothetical protein QM628_00190 [Propionicimonas sp.]
MRKIIRGGLIVFSVVTLIAIATGNFPAWSATVSGWFAEYVWPPYNAAVQWLVNQAFAGMLS